MKEKIYKLTLDICNPDIPFKIERSISGQSGDLVAAFSLFQMELIRLLRELHDEEIKEIKKSQINDDDIPF